MALRCSNTPVGARFVIVNPGRISKRRIVNKSSSSCRNPSAYVDTEADLVYLASLITINAEKGKIRQVFCPLRLKYSETEGERQGISHRHALAEGRDISHHHYFGCLTSGFLSCDAHVSTSCLLSRNGPLPLPSFQDVLDGLTESLDETQAHIHKGIERAK